LAAVVVRDPVAEFDERLACFADPLNFRLFGVVGGRLLLCVRPVRRLLRGGAGGAGLDREPRVAGSS
jgi:hypothetical protein